MNYTETLGYINKLKKAKHRCKVELSIATTPAEIERAEKHYEQWVEFISESYDREVTYDTFKREIELMKEGGW